MKTYYSLDAQNVNKDLWYYEDSKGIDIYPRDPMDSPYRRHLKTKRAKLRHENLLEPIEHRTKVTAQRDGQKKSRVLAQLLEN